MTVKASGPLKQSEITTEFGGSAMQVHRGQTWYTPGTDIFTVETFVPGSNTWVVPLYKGNMTVEIWGAGGSGGEAYNGNTVSGGGQGGSYKRYIIPEGILLVGSTQTIIVGIGGPGVQSNGGSGNPGGYSSFGNAVWASGGYGGRGQASPIVPAGSFTPSVMPTSWVLEYQEEGGDGGYSSNGGNTTYAGAGGGGGQNTGGVYREGGVSTYGGNGGKGWGDAIYADHPTANGKNPGGGGGGGIYIAHSGRGGDGLVKVSYIATPLTLGSFPQSNLKFSLFYSKQSNDPAGADILPFVTPGTYNCIVPLHRNQVTIDLWGAGGGTNGGSKAGDTTVSWGDTVLTAGGGYSGGGGGRRYIGPGGAGGTATGGTISENGAGGIGGGGYNSNTLSGGNAGGVSYGGGGGGLGGGIKWSYGLPAVMYGDNGYFPGGGGGGLFVYDYSPSPGFSGTGGGGGGGFVRSVITNLPQNTTLTINVGQGGDSPNCPTGFGGNGKVVVSWS
jgi:hypothetical protein